MKTVLFALALCFAGGCSEVEREVERSEQRARESQQARKQYTIASLRGIGDALQLYHLDNRQFPSTEQGLKALVESESLRENPLDGWDNEYVYVGSGRTYELRSLGADGKEGGEDANADINYFDYARPSQKRYEAR